MNMEKTVGLLIRPRSLHLSPLDPAAVVSCGGLPVEMVTSTCLLGVIVDDALSWAAHVDPVCRKVGRKIGALRHSYCQLSCDARRLFLLSVIQPELEYAACVTVPTMSGALKDRLLSVWRKAVRCASGAKWQDAVPPLVDKLRITPISHRWLLQYVKVIRRCHSNCAPLPLSNKLDRTSHCYHIRGNKNTFTPSLSSTRSGCVSFMKRAPLLWNSLNPDVQSAPSLSSFKTKLFVQLGSPDSSAKLLQLAFGNPTIY